MKFKERRFSPNYSVWPVKRVHASPPEHGMFSIHETGYLTLMFFIKQMFRWEQISKVTGFCFSLFACTVGNQSKV